MFVLQTLQITVGEILADVCTELLCLLHFHVVNMISQNFTWFSCIFNVRSKTKHDTVLLTTILWVWSSRQFLIHQVVHPSSMSLKFRDRDIVLDSVRCFAQIQVDDICCHLFCSYLMYQCGNTVLEGQQICAWFLLRTAMLAVSNHQNTTLFPNVF